MDVRRAGDLGYAGVRLQARRNQPFLLFTRPPSAALDGRDHLHTLSVTGLLLVLPLALAAFRLPQQGGRHRGDAWRRSARLALPDLDPHRPGMAAASRSYEHHAAFPWRRPGRGGSLILARRSLGKLQPRDATRCASKRGGCHGYAMAALRRLYTECCVLGRRRTSLMSKHSF